MFNAKSSIWLLVILAGLLAASCSGASVTPTLAPTPTPTLTPTVAPTAAPTLGPATQSMSLTDSTGKNLALSNAAIRCNFPSTQGLLINIIAQPADPNLSVYINVLPASITVRYDSGSGSTYTERNFNGSGVTSFDAGKGAKIDTTLTEVTTAGGNPGKLGLLASLKGTIDCGNQLPGSTTLTLSGTSPKGEVSGGLNSANVECISSSAYGAAVSVIAIASAGGTPTLVVIYITPNTMSASFGTGSFFRNTPSATATLTSGGATVSGDLTEQNPPAGTTAHTMHLSGSAVCGTTLIS